MVVVSGICYKRGTGVKNNPKNAIKVHTSNEPGGVSIAVRP